MTTQDRLAGFSETKLLALRKLLERKDIGRERTLAVTGSNLKVLRTGSPLLFIYPATDGSVGYMHNYLPHIPERWGVYAVQTPGLDDDRTPYRTVPDIAAHGVREIRSIQPDGPYYIAGNCMGGLPAYETASQLQRLGADVALVLHLMPNFNRPWRDLPTSTDRLHLRAVIDYVYIIERLLKVEVDMPFDTLAELAPDQQIDAVVAHIAAGGWLSDFDLDMFRRRMVIYRANLEAMLTYAPTGGFTGTVTVLAVGDTTRGEDSIHALSPYVAPLRSAHHEKIDTIFVDADGGALFDGAQPAMDRIGVALRELLARY